MPDVVPTPKFVLIDHSICDLSGHHFQYAAHVLEAAARAGFDPVLITNRKFAEAEQAPCRVLPLYEFGFWPEPSHSAIAVAAAAWLRRFRALAFRAHLHFRYSKAGLAWLGRAGWNSDAEPPGRRSLAGRLFGLAMRALPVLHLAAHLVFFPLACLLAGLWSVVYWLALGCWCFLAVPLRRAGWLRRYLSARLAEARGYAGSLPLAGRYLRIPGAPEPQAQAATARQRKAFQRDTAALLDRLQISPGDMVFIPTISPEDMLGLAAAIRHRPDAAGATWHLLFRRNIYEGRREDYAAQDGSLAGLRRSFTIYRHTAGNARTYFYTDTEELTEQYNRLGVFTFHTLPIPHTYAPEDRVRHEGPLRVAYLGDARREKGFHHLPRLIDDLRAHQTPAAHFTIQCNFNVPGGEPEASVARDQLEWLPSSLVTLYKEPLTSAAYENLLLSADINLLLYDARNYYARSSGILVESLAAGIPAIVPAGSWLARQFLEPHYRHQEGLVNGMAVLDRPASIRWLREGANNTSAEAGGYVEAGHNHAAYCRLKVPYGAALLLLRIAMAHNHSELLFSVAQFDEDSVGLRGGDPARLEMRGAENRATAVVRILPGARDLLVSLGSTGPGTTARVSSVVATFLAGEGGELPPIGAVGLICNSPDELCDAVAEMLSHYPHYQSTALKFAAELRSYHNPDRLVADLAANAGATRPESLKVVVP